jgi:hypothetical protein
MTLSMLRNVRIRPVSVLAPSPRALVAGPVAAGWLAALGLVLLTALAGLGRPAFAGDQPVSLREALTGSTAQDGRSHAHAPPIARYVSGDGDRFVFDRTGNVALMRFEGAEEVWALRATPAPSGDTIYKNDVGETVLRSSRLGGLTLFTTHNPGGEPAQLVGAAPASRPNHVSTQALAQLLQASMLRVARASGLPQFKMHAEGDGEPFLYADTIVVTTDTLLKMASMREGRPYIKRIREVYIHPGSRMDARLRNGVLEVILSPRDGIAGRPSSSRIAKAIVGAR